MAFEASSLVLTLIVCLGLLTLAFAIKFLVPALLLQVTLERLQKRLRAISDPTPTALSGAFASAGPLRAIWQEYSATLHQQTEFQTSTGLYETVSLRSTVPAEYVFTPEAVFESRLGSEFFKHLPGVLTAISVRSFSVSLQRRGKLSARMASKT
jgi:putative membrane protein